MNTKPTIFEPLPARDGSLPINRSGYPYMPMPTPPEDYRIATEAERESLPAGSMCWDHDFTNPAWSKAMFRRACHSQWYCVPENAVAQTPPESTPTNTRA
jgi:hypothetical protein